MLFYWCRVFFSKPIPWSFFSRSLRLSFSLFKTRQVVCLCCVSLSIYSPQYGKYRRRCMCSRALEPGHGRQGSSGLAAAKWKCYIPNRVKAVNFHLPYSPQNMCVRANYSAFNPLLVCLLCAALHGVPESGAVVAVVAWRVGHFVSLVCCSILRFWIIIFCASFQWNMNFYSIPVNWYCAAHRTIKSYQRMQENVEGRAEKWEWYSRKRQRRQSLKKHLMSIPFRGFLIKNIAYFKF